MHETVQFLERHGLWISRAAWIITNTWWRFPVRFALTPAGLKNIEMWRYHPLRCWRSPFHGRGFGSRVHLLAFEPGTTDFLAG
jgi:hypothetical protein